MSRVGAHERITQNRVVKLFQQELGYTYLGNGQDRAENSNIEVALLCSHLERRGYPAPLITKAIDHLVKIATNQVRSLYDINKEIYSLLRYGIQVSPDIGQNNQTIWLIDWANPDKNDFAIAEEVTVTGIHNRRPDIVLYVNGIALGILELKRSTISVSEGIRQNLSSQRKEFIRSFFNTVHLVMAGNDTEGVRYGTIETPEKYYLSWKEESVIGNALDRHLTQICGKERLLEIIHDFIVYDAGVKKTCRQNQYFGVKAAQEYVKIHEGGIIWHTQGSGKSLTMVWLAKWIRENIKDARILIITDRTELDEQIEKVFKGVQEDIYRTISGADLVAQLNTLDQWLICSLVHKFKDETDMSGYLEDIQRNLPAHFTAKGDIYVFVDECHRTQSGDLHKAMKAVLPKATFIGFTGTPLLKADKQKSIEVFGRYIHTYKFNQAVEDKVVLDLRYEARDIDQSITSPAKINQWFEAKTKGLSPLALAQLKQKWGTMQKVLSSQSRLEKIVADIVLDMETKDRLQSGRGNAMLVAGSIYEACKFYELFQRTPLGDKCAIITSYSPSANDIRNEDTGEGETEKLEKYQIYQQMLSNYFREPPEQAIKKVEQFEREVKKKFIDEPGQMKLLIVVDKLLTGFDAPSATYLYIDKQMRDHGLFQAICRINRLDGDDKEYGYVIDYKDLFKSLEKSIFEYTSGAFDAYEQEDVQGLLADRLGKARERLQETRETLKALCEPVDMPKDTQAYIKYFCALDRIEHTALKESEPKRLALYKYTVSLIRAYANIANEMAEAGYTPDEIKVIKGEVEGYEKIRREIKIASGDYIDMKMFEPAMRHLIDTYIRAEESEKISTFDDLSLIELIVKRGPEVIQELPEGIRTNEEAIAETIENNLRKVIIDEQPINPKYYSHMSELLKTLIQQRREKALDYQAYLQRIVELAGLVKQPAASPQYPQSLNTSAKRALFDNLDQNEALALAIDGAVINTKKDDWRGNKIKEREVKNAIRDTLGEEDPLLEEIFELVKNQREY